MLIIKFAFLNKILKKRFFIFYDNINFYEKVKNQQLYNKAAFLNYTIGYICFMNILSSLINSNDN